MLIIRVGYSCTLALFLSIIPFLSHSQNSTHTIVPFFFYEDTTKALSFKSISEPGFASNFRPLKANAFWHDVSESFFWIRFNVSDTIQVQRFLELSCPNFAEVVYYQPSLVKVYKEYHAGMLSNFNNRPIPIDRFAFPITNGVGWHYIKIQTDHFINTEFYVKKLEEIIEDASARNLVYFLYMGLMLTIVAGVIFYIYLIRYYSYLFYIGYIFFISSVALIERGYYFQLFWPNHPEINGYFPLLPFGISLCMLLFLRKIWISHTIVTILYRITLWGLTVLPFLSVLYFSFNDHYAEAALITQTHSLLVAVLVIIISLISYANAEKSLKLPLKLISAGFIILCLSGFIFVASKNHLLPTNFFTENAIIFGSALEVCFLTTALIIRSDEIYKKQKLRLSEQYK